MQQSRSFDSDLVAEIRKILHLLHYDLHYDSVQLRMWGKELRAASGELRERCQRYRSRYSGSCAKAT